jgi:two-component system, NarL family, captular synthesis response regulator RcsB
LKLRVVLADDHPFVLLGVRSALAKADGIEVVGEAHNPGALFRMLDTVPCDVVVTDLTMPGDPDDARDGLPLVRRLRRDWPLLRIVVLTGITNVVILRAVRCAGVTAMLRKSEPMKELARAVRDAGCGRAYIGDSIRRDFGIACPEATGSVSTPRLSPRELEVVRQFAEGRPVTEIARMLDRDVRTVSRQKRDAMTKLGVSNDPALVASLRAHGLS